MSLIRDSCELLKCYLLCPRALLLSSTLSNRLVLSGGCRGDKFRYPRKPQRSLPVSLLANPSNTFRFSDVVLQLMNPHVWFRNGAAAVAVAFSVTAFVQRRPCYATASAPYTALYAAVLACVFVAWPSLGRAGFDPAPSMIGPRSHHSATLLPSGQVLVTGGAAGGTLASAELYDPASNSWKAAGSLTIPRSNHTATLLPSGQVLGTGGFGEGGTLASAELYDPDSNLWRSAGSMVNVRRSHTATLLPSGRVLITGGWSGIATLASAELYDPASDMWSAARSMTAARYNHTATLLPSGQVLVTGGFGEGGTLASAELYDPASNTWRAAAALAAVRAIHTATLLPSGKVLVAGGEGTPFAQAPPPTFASAELYDPGGNRWSSAGFMATSRGLHTATLLPSGQVLVAGGAHTEGLAFPNPIASAELYDPASNTWSTAESMATARASHTATLLASGMVLAAGGFGLQTPNPFLASAELYDFQTQAAVEYYYAAWNYYFVTSFPDEIAALDAGAFGGLWQRTGETFNVWSVQTGLASPTCRFFSTAFAPKSSHFYTPFPIECAAVKNNPSWLFESIAFYIQIPIGYGTGNGSCPQGTNALYRLYNNGMGGAPNHRYTTNLAIFNTMLAQGWLFEGEANTKVFACVPQ